MFTRRAFVTSAAAISVAATASHASAQEACAVFTKDRQTAITPDLALQRLKDGNARFLAGTTVNCNLAQQVKDTANSQAPFASILGCIDSRVPPELVFDQRIGDIFAARIAGNFVNDDIIGSLEFTTAVAGSKLIVVLGHSSCGAIKGAVDNAKLGKLTQMLTKFKPAVEANASFPGEKDSHNKKLVQAVADTHAKLAAKQLVDQSDVLKGLVDQGTLKIVAAMHDLETGKVSFF
jgi:carbonic anhydrase